MHNAAAAAHPVLYHHLVDASAAPLPFSYGQNRITALQRGELRAAA
jgi:hypothetical protein